MATFELLISLVTGCLSNLRALSDMISSMFYSSGRHLLFLFFTDCVFGGLWQRYTDAWASLVPLWPNLTTFGVSKGLVSPPSSEYCAVGSVIWLWIVDNAQSRHWQDPVFSHAGTASYPRYQMVWQDIQPIVNKITKLPDLPSLMSALLLKSLHHMVQILESIEVPSFSFSVIIIITMTMKLTAKSQPATNK